ncbi:hypothetical protein GO279_01780 [Ralstonia solanacearum]|nr:hypothetical protein [Ralstonia solanacearum]NKA55490.1 hypothetical protein [Ralstonia solanacearum]NKA68997.1 hypothetical protein [Ralstonia solanacearum]NKA83307.1 hypothetical protein [Ralstonia solanacearum]NKF54728.1 hypothetical protein [Ralstonia solanacearum]
MRGAWGNLPWQRSAGAAGTTTAPGAGTAGSHYRVAVFGGVAQYVDTVSA